VTTITDRNDGWTGFSNSGGGKWYYRKPVTISNAGASALNNYQVYVTTGGIGAANLKTQGKLQSDYDDLRFGDSNNKELSYWIEPSTANATGFWVKVATIGASGSTVIYAYYGNAQAAAVSNGASTFSFFDDFLGTSLSGEWSGTATVSNGVMSHTSNEIVTASRTVDDFRIRSRARSTSSPAESTYLFRGNTISSAYALHDSSVVDTWTFAIAEDAISRTNTSNALTANTWYVYDIKMVGGAINAKRLNDTTRAELNTNTWTDSPVSHTSGKYGFRVYTDRTQEVDWIAICKCASPEPAVSAGSEQENRVTAKIAFSVAGQGTLVGSTSQGAVNGRATVIMKSGTLTGVATVTSTTDNLSQGTVTVTMALSGTPVKLILTANPASIIANGITTSLITAGIHDTGNTLVSTAANELTFSVNGQGTLLGTTKKSASAGYATVVLQSGTLEGAATVKSTAAGLAEGTAVITLTPDPEAPAKLFVTANPASIMANGNSTSLISAFIRNSGDFPVSTATNLISFGISGEGTLLGTTQKNAAAGRATVTMKSTINYGTAVVTATSDNLSGDDFTVITTSVSVPLSAPENLVTSGTRHSISLSWTAGTNNVKYKVESKMQGGNYAIAADNHTFLTLTQDNLKAGTT
jgi:hypothetical protein